MTLFRTLSYHVESFDYWDINSLLKPKAPPKPTPSYLLMAMLKRI